MSLEIFIPHISSSFGYELLGLNRSQMKEVMEDDKFKPLQQMSLASSISALEFRSFNLSAREVLFGLRSNSSRRLIVERKSSINHHLHYIIIYIYKR